MVTRQITLLMLLILVTPVAMALDSIQASVDSNPVSIQEYFVLNITANDELEAGNLDTSILMRDFVVGRTSVSRSTQIINFDAKKETRWQILLAAKKLGKVTIPSFEINGIRSNAIVLDVVEPGNKPKESKPLFIETDISTEEAYVGQLITYKVRLYLAADLQRGVLSAPEIEGAQIKQLGEDDDRTEIINGRQFRVIERTYGITADFPGELTIEGASFAGDVLINTPSRRGGLFTFNESRPMQTKAKKRVISIEPLPLHAKGTLVADLVLLNDTWDESVTEYQVGSPITRNITLVASNTDETSLPEFSLPPLESFKSYPEKPVRRSAVRNGQLVAQLTQAIALVPTKPGKYTLPEITLPWWNSQLKRQEIAKIPAREVTVTGAQLVTQPQLQEMTKSNAPSGANAGLWPWLSLFLAIAWLATFIAWYRKPTIVQSKPAVTSQSEDLPKAANEQLKKLVQACESNDAKSALIELQRYVSCVYNHEFTLEQIGQLSAELKSVIGQLQYSVYGNTTKETNLVDVIKAAKNMQKSRREVKKSTLVDLNP